MYFINLCSVHQITLQINVYQDCMEAISLYMFYILIQGQHYFASIKQHEAEIIQELYICSFVKLFAVIHLDYSPRKPAAVDFPKNKRIFLGWLLALLLQWIFQPGIKPVSHLLHCSGSLPLSHLEAIQVLYRI